MVRQTPSCRKALIAAVLGFTGAGAQAETSPYYIGVSQSFTRESNVFKVNEADGPKSDTISGTSLYGGFDQPLGRQRVYGNASVTANRYSDLDRLNYLGKNLSAGLDWSTIERLSGNLRLSYAEGQGDYSRPDAVQTTEKNLQTTRSMGASVSYALSSNLGLNAGIEHRNIDVSNEAFASSEVSSDVATVGASYGTSSLLRLGTGLRFTRDNYPKSQQTGPNAFVERTVRRRDLDLTAVWTPTELTAVDARISFGRDRTSQVQDSSGDRVTGRLGVRYSVTGKLNLNASISRDTGSNTTFQSLQNPAPGGANGFFVDSNELSISTNLGASYALTSKVSLSAGYNRSNGTYRNANGSTSDNVTSAWSLGGSYAAARNLTLGCGAGRDTRSNGSGGVPGYTSNSVNCTVSYQLR
jgi:outer membrane receptor for ferrienterochelin and colicin